MASRFPLVNSSNQNDTLPRQQHRGISLKTRSEVALVAVSKAMYTARASPVRSPSDTLAKGIAFHSGELCSCTYSVIGAQSYLGVGESTIMVPCS